MTKFDLPQIKDMLRDRIEDLCRALLPDGRRDGRLWVSHNPVTGDKGHEPALKVALNRDTGAWTDWRSGDKGDVIGLIGYINTGRADAVGEALSWASDWLGLRRMDRAERDRWQRQIADRRQAAERQAIAAAQARAAAVARLWQQGTAYGAGTAAETLGLGYFAARGLPLDRVPCLDVETFRFVPDLEWWRGRSFKTINGRRVLDRRGPRFPAILSALRAPTGQVTGVHCTFLDPARPQKAPVDQAKLMFGDALGAVIRISHGPEGLPPETAVEPHPLAIGEGIETMGSVAIAVPEARAWAGGSLAGMRNARVDFGFISSVHPCAENDWNNAQAIAQYEAAIAALAAQGKPVAPMRPHFGSDFNDVMQGE